MKSKKNPNKKIEVWEKVFESKKGVKLPKSFGKMSWEVESQEWAKKSYPKNKMITIKFPEMNTKRGQYQLNFLLELAKLWNKYPEQRFGQMLFNYSRIGTRAGDSILLAGLIRDPFHYADEDLLNDIKNNNK